MKKEYGESEPSVSTKVEPSIENSGWGRWGEGWGGWGNADPRAGGTDPRAGGSSNAPRILRSKVAISIDYNSNTLFIAGSADRMDFISAYVRQIDRGSSKCAIGGKEFWKTYNVSPGSAVMLTEYMAKSEEFRNCNVKLLVQRSSQFMAYGYPGDHLEIERFLTPVPECNSAPLVEKSPRICVLKFPHK